MSSWIGAKELSPLLEKVEEDNLVDKGATLLDQGTMEGEDFPLKDV